HRFYDAWELDQDSVARGLDNSSAMLGNFRVDQCTPMRLEAHKRAGFVSTHQSRIANNISDHDCRQPPLRDQRACRNIEGQCPLNRELSRTEGDHMKRSSC